MTERDIAEKLKDEELEGQSLTSSRTTSRATS